MVLISMWELCFCTFSKNCFVFFLFALFLSKPLYFWWPVLIFCVGWEWETGEVPFGNRLHLLF